MFLGTVFVKNKNKVYYYILPCDENFIVDKIEGNIYANKTFDREIQSEYEIYILASYDPDLYLIGENKSSILNNTNFSNLSIASVKIIINDENDNIPTFSHAIYNATVNDLAITEDFVIQVFASDPDFGVNSSFSYYIKSSYLFKYGSKKSSGSIFPPPFHITSEGKIFCSKPMSEYRQQRFLLEVIAREKSFPRREVATHIYVRN